MRELAQLGETFGNRITFIEFIEIPYDGRQNVRFYFDNGLCMSVGCNGRTYSDHSEGLYEIAVIVSEDDNGHVQLMNVSEWHGTVLGWQNANEIRYWMGRVSSEGFALSNEDIRPG